MEAFAAVGLAGNIIQFIDFASNLMRAAREIHHSTTGLPESLLEIETTSKRMKELATELSSSVSSGRLASPRLGEIADELIATADEIDKALAKVRLKQSARSRKSFMHVLRVIWTRKDIEALDNRLNSLRGEAIIHVSASLIDENSKIRDTLRTLEVAQERFEMNTSQSLKNLRKDVINAVKQLKNSIRVHDISVERRLQLMESPFLVRDTYSEQISADMQRLYEKLSNLHKAAAGIFGFLVVTMIFAAVCYITLVDMANKANAQSVWINAMRNGYAERLCECTRPPDPI